MKIYRNIAYSENYTDRRVADIYCPNENNGITILLIHGGGWVKGDKTQWEQVLPYLLAKKYICVCANYRLATTHKFPAQIEDMRLIMDFLRNKAEKYGVNGDKIVAIGSSAGATLATSLGVLDENNLLGKTAELLSENNVPDAIVAYYPVSTLRSDMQNWSNQDEVPNFVMAYMGVTEKENNGAYKEASLIENDFKTFAPFLLFHGTSDDLVPYEQSVQLSNKIREKGFEVQFETVANAPHGFAYALKFEFQYETLDTAIKFIEKTFKA